MINANTQTKSLYGLSAEFAEPEELLEAARNAKEAGYDDIEAYSPFEVHGLTELLGHNSRWLGWMVLAAMILGVIGAFLIQWWTGAIHYPIIVGGKPLLPMPALTIIMFETAILFGGLTATAYMFISNGFPKPYQPIFNTRGIEAASRNRFFICIRTTDDNFNLQETRQFLQGLEPEPINVSEVRC
jgi:hypothetical protein